MAVHLALDSLYQRSNNVSYKIVLATIAIVFLSRPLILVAVLDSVIIAASIVTVVLAFIITIELASIVTIVSASIVTTVAASIVTIVSASTALSLAIVELILMLALASLITIVTPSASETPNIPKNASNYHTLVETTKL